MSNGALIYTCDLSRSVHVLQECELKNLRFINNKCKHNFSSVEEQLVDKTLIKLVHQCNTVADHRACYYCIKCGLHTHLDEPRSSRCQKGHHQLWLGTKWEDCRTCAREEKGK